jgi:hypothetical protein
MTIIVNAEEGKKREREQNLEKPVSFVDYGKASDGDGKIATQNHWVSGLCSSSGIINN